MRAGLAVGLLLVASAAAYPATYHVKPTGNDASSGLSWNEAKATVAGALAVANEGDRVWVAAGTYHERIRNRTSGGISIDVALYGGFAGTEIALEQRDVAANPTILDGDSAGTVVTIDSFAGPAMRVDGFRIRNGDAAMGGGMLISVAAPTVANNDLLGNGADFGGGIAVVGYRTIPPEAHAVIESNVIQVNRAGSGGGGIAVVGASPDIVGNVLLRNTTGGEGGGIGVWVSESSRVSRPRIRRNFIFENAANLTTPGLVSGGGGIYATERNIGGEPVNFGICAPRIDNNVVAANAAIACGGGIAIVNAETEPAPVVNNTVVANSGSGICWGMARPTLANNIVARNTWGLEEDPGNPYAASISHNDVWGNILHDRATDYHQLADRTGSDGNISVDPLLVAYGSGRLRLQPGSPCIDAGSDAQVEPGATDVDGQTRILGARVDIGADESDGTVWEDVPRIVRVRPGGDDAADGSTWILAKATVQNAVEAAWAAGGGEVWVEQGIYEEHVTLRAWVDLYGGFAGNETSREQRDPTNLVTTLDGAGTPPVVSCGLSGYRVGGIDGFEITGGGHYTGGVTIPPPSSPAGWGGGIRCTVASPVIRSNTIARNSLGDPNTTPFDPGEGAGIGLVGSHALIESNTIMLNEALNRDSRGGGIYAEWSAPDVRFNSIARNRAPAGAALFAVAARPMLFNNWISQNEHYVLPPAYAGSRTGAVSLVTCWDVDVALNYFVGNVAAVGGGLYLEQPYRGTVANNIFVSNQAFDRQLGTGGEGGAMWLMIQSDPQDAVVVTGNTFSGNSATHAIFGELGGAMALLPLSDEVVIANNVAAFNSSGFYRRAGLAASPTLVCNDLFNTGANYVHLGPGPTDVVADPLFVDRLGGNYRLQSTSPAVDAGEVAWVVTATDLDGAPRTQDGDGDGDEVVDIGAYELSPDLDGDGTPDWIDDDDDDDGVADPEDCAPLDAQCWTVPSEVTNLRLHGTGPTELSWEDQDPGAVFDIVNGLLSDLAGSDGFSSAACLEEDVDGPSWTDTSGEPPQGETRYYLVRAASVCGDGGWGAGRDIGACL